MKHNGKKRNTRRGIEAGSGWKTIAGAAVLSAVGTLAVAAQNVSSSANAFSGGLPQGPSANTTNPEQTPGGPIAAGQRRFDIAAGELTTALEAFGHATGLHVHSTIPTDKLAGFQTRGVKGVYTPADALGALLSGTGLDSRFTTPERVEITIRSNEHVDVNASVASIGLQQFPQPLLDTAQTVSVVPQYILGEQADTTLRDSLRNVPGISIAAGEGGAQGDNLTIRGFSARNDIFLDGIRDFGSYYRDSFNYEAVDVLEGPASVEFGRGSTGGVVNQESKQPVMSQFARGTVQLGTDEMRRGTVDLNTPLPSAPGGGAFRVNFAGEETGVAERDVVQTRRFGIAPSIALGLNTKTRAVLQYLHEEESSIPDYGLPYFGAGVAPVARTNYYGFASDNYLRTSPDVLTGKVEHDFGLHFTVRNILRWANYPRDVRITEPQVNTAATNPSSITRGGVITVKCDPTVANTVTTSACYPIGSALSSVQVKRNQLTARATEDMLWDQATGSVRFALGHISNEAVVLVEGGRERSRPTRNYYALPYTSLLSPNSGDAFSPLYTYTAGATHVESQSFGIDFLDTLRLTEWLLLSGGVRYDYFSTQARNAASSTSATNLTPASFGERLDKQPTYRASVTVKPRPNGSLYFDYGTSFNPAAESLSLSANNAISPPEYNETFELGAKWDFLRDRLNLNGSVFRTEKLNARETDPNNSNNIINSGNQLVRGVQIGALGHMPSNFDLILGYAYLDGRVESSVVNASPFASINLLLIKAGDPRANTAPYFINPAGFTLANVPRNSGNFWVTHRLLKGFTGGFGGSYVGARRASSTSVIGQYNDATPVDPATVPLYFKSIPGYALLNAMVRRPISERIEFQVNVNNLANKFFIDQPHPNHLVPGEGMNAQFGMNYKF